MPSSAATVPAISTTAPAPGARDRHTAEEILRIELGSTTLDADDPLERSRGTRTVIRLRRPSVDR